MLARLLLRPGVVVVAEGVEGSSFSWGFLISSNLLEFGIAIL